MAEEPKPRGRLYTLAQAAEHFFPGTNVKASSLRLELDRGRLGYEKIAGKFFVTEADIEEMRRLCRNAPRERAQPDPEQEAKRAQRALDALNWTLRRKSPEHRKRLLPNGYRPPPKSAKK